MSRCFPYPPPGCEKIGFSHEALIESRKRGENAKKERKEKKRERKKEEKKRRNGEIEMEKHGHKKRHKGERSQDDQKGQERRKRKKNKPEQLEKSSLTEEHGHPINSQNLCNSSDSTLNSKSWQKQSSPSDGWHNNGSIVRIRVAAHTHKEQPSVLASSDASLLKKNEAVLRHGGDMCEQPCSTSAIASQNIDLKLTKDKSSSGDSKILSRKAQTGLSPSYLKFRDLIENWVPPLSQSDCIDFDDQEWLFPEKRSLSFGAESLSRECSAPCIYALPYVVPL